MDANTTPDGGQHEYTVGEAASLHGLTVRTLHHWEQRGLISPRTMSSTDTATTVMPILSASPSLWGIAPLA